MAKFLRGHIEFDSPVCEIRAKRTGYEAIYREGKGCHRCDHIIMAIPFCVLRKVSFSPTLPPSKRRAVEGQLNTSVTRTFLQFRERVWEEMGLNGSADTDQSIMSVFAGEPTKSSRGILESYTAGQSAREMAAMPEPQRVKVVLEQLDRLFPGIRQLYEGRYYSICWDRVPWALGAYAYYAKGQVANFYRQVAWPVGRIFFAGDHTTPQPGWMDSAIRSGERAAREVLASLSGPRIR
jgi:monoamine oxidase